VESALLLDFALGDESAAITEQTDFFLLFLKAAVINAWSFGKKSQDILLPRQVRRRPFWARVRLDVPVP
jgi:hypothetical protein